MSGASHPPAATTRRLPHPRRRPSPALTAHARPTSTSRRSPSTSPSGPPSTSCTLRIERGAPSTPSSALRTAARATTLHMISGSEARTPARVYLGGGADHRTAALQARRRRGLLQSYALFPHLSVEQQHRLRLERKKASSPRFPARGRGARARPARRSRQAQAGAASGGQQQRVALARALVNRRARCCSTSRSARSTCACASSCRSRPSGSSRTSASPSCTSRTTRRRP